MELETDEYSGIEYGAKPSYNMLVAMCTDTSCIYNTYKHNQAGGPFDSHCLLPKVHLGTKLIHNVHPAVVDVVTYCKSRTEAL